MKETKTMTRPLRTQSEEIALITQCACTIISCTYNIPVDKAASLAVAAAYQVLDEAESQYEARKEIKKIASTL